MEELRNLMEARGWDAVVIRGSDPHGSEYFAPRWEQVRRLSGFTGEGDFVVTLDSAGIWTDSRYFILAGRELEDSGIELHKTRVPGAVMIPEWLAQRFCDKEGTVVIAVDGLCQDAASVREIRSAFADAGRDPEDEVRIVDVPDLPDEVWEDRPRIPSEPVITLGDDLTGESRQDKILWIRNFIIDSGCDAILVSALDEIAWLLNVRGSDIPYNPLVISYLVVSLDSVDWYVTKGRHLDEETRDSFDELRDEGVGIHGYDEIDLALSTLVGDGGRLYADSATLNYHLYTLLEGDNLRLGPSPVPLRKAVKNETEIAGMHEAHVEDGLAVEQFLFWLDSRLRLRDIITERDATDKLHELRSSIPGFRGESFETISAYGEGAALPHYVSPEEDVPVLLPQGLYLCDSGAHYLFGTTDITRTIPLGPCSALEREDYTLVLKGHIDLAMAVFPAGTCGAHIDVLAREPLWRSKRNFGHGTGHGVGQYLNVHEGPQSLRQNLSDVPFRPGMTITDEPGIYREGSHGVRHENILLCVEDGKNDFGSWLRFETLTLCHFDTSVLLPELLDKDELDWLNAYNRRVYETLAPRLPSEVAEWLAVKTKPVL